MSSKTGRLEGKVALITGAASGIGEETARLFVEHGCLVMIADVQDDLGEAVVAALAAADNGSGSGGGYQLKKNVISYCHCDVRDEKQVEAAVNATLDKYGRLDILFSNAGILGPFGGIVDLDLNAFDNTMAVNVRGVAATIKHVARAMVAAGTRGSIVCTASVAASIGGAGPHAYTASKHALVGLVRTACAELGAHGIRVNCVSPFGVATPLTCGSYNAKPSVVEASTCALANLKGIVLKARHVAEAALFLASDESAYVSGQNLAVDGGFAVVNHSYSADP